MPGQPGMPGTGETGWTRPLDPEEDPLGFQIAIAGPSYAVHTNGGWNLHRIEDGELITAAGAVYNSLNQDVNGTDFAREHQLVDGEEICAVDGVAGGEVLIRRRTCATVTSAASGTLTAPVFRLEEIDPATGETVWTMDLPEGRWLDKIYSTAPLIVSLRDEEFGGSRELVFVDQGQITGQVPLGDTGVAADDEHLFIEELCRGDLVVYNAVEDCGGMVTHDDRLYASPTSMFGGNPVTAMNATTGAVEWSYETEDFPQQVVLTADEEGVVVFQDGFEETPSQVVRISPDGQQVEPLFRTDDIYLPASSFTAFLDRRLLFSPVAYDLDYDVAAYGADKKIPSGSGGSEGAEGAEGAADTGDAP